MDLFLIDAIGPFFRGLDRPTINWSKIPWGHLDTADPDLLRQSFARIRHDFDSFCRRVKALGYNAISLDDLAHLADHPFYEPDVRRQIALFQSEFQPLFATAAHHGLAVFITMDVISYTPELKRRIGTRPAPVRAFLSSLISSFFQKFPGVAGVIARIGESDGKDVRGTFHSELHLRTPSRVRRFLQHILPTFESLGKKLIFRTWTVGAYHVGDLIWHPSRFRHIFANISSRALIISMKYGDSDFFRFLSLNPNFFRSTHAKIIELQARREYEGCGEFPAPIGSDCESFAAALASAQNVVGISVWCQTGGWVPFRRLAFLDGGNAIWTECNAALAIRIFKFRESASQAALSFASSHGIPDPDAFVRLLALAERAVEDLLYTRGFAEQKLFFRRVRIPPLLSVYWNNIFINHSTRKLMRHFVADPYKALREADSTLASFPEIRGLAEKCLLPAEDIDFMRDSFHLFALARQYYFLPFSDEIRHRIRETKKAYKKKWPKSLRPRYRVKVDYRPFHLRRHHLAWLLGIALRRRPSYRLLDHLFTLHLLGFAYRTLTKHRPKIIPKFARKSAMGIDTIFR